jgi:hypothetical protein
VVVLAATKISLSIPLQKRTHVVALSVIEMDEYYMIVCQKKYELEKS